MAVGEAGDVQIVETGIALTEDRGNGTALERRRAEIELIDRAGFRCEIPASIIAIGTDEERRSIRTERNGGPELIPELDRLQIDVIRPGGGTKGDQAPLHPAIEAGVGKGEEIDRARIRNAAGNAVIARCAHDQRIAPERDSRTESVEILDTRHINALRPRSAETDLADQRAARKQAVAEREQEDRSKKSARRIAVAGVARRAHRQPVAVQRQRRTEFGAERQRNGDILATDIALAERGLQHRRAEPGIGKAEQIDRPQIEPATCSAGIAGCPDGQSQPVQCHGRAELLAGYGASIAQAGDREIPDAGIAEAQGIDQADAGKVRTGKGEEMGSSCAARCDIPPIVARRSDHQPFAIECHRAAEAVIGRQLERKAGKTAIVRADDVDLVRATKGLIDKVEEIDRARIRDFVIGTIIAARAHDELQALQRHRAAEKVLVKRSQAQPARLERLTRAHGQRIDAAGIIAAGKGEQIDRAGVEEIVPEAVIARRADRKAQSVERNRAAKGIVLAQIDDVYIVAAGIAPADGGQQQRREEARLANVDNMDGPRAIDRHHLIGTGIACGADRDCGILQRNRRAEGSARAVDRPRREEFEIDEARQRAVAEPAIVEVEHIDRTGIRCGIAQTVIARRAHRQPQPAERDRAAEPVVALQAGDREILAAAIAGTDDRLQRRGAEARIAKGEEINRAGIEQAVFEPVILRRADGEAVSIQRYGGAKGILALQPLARQRQPAHRQIACPQRARQAAAAELRIGKAVEIDRAGIRHRIAAAVVARCADRQQVAEQRDALPEPVCLG